MHGMGVWHWGFGVLIWIAVFVMVLIVFKTLVKDD